MSLHFSMHKQMAPSECIDTCWMFMEAKLDVSTVRWCVSTAVTVSWQMSHILNGHADIHKCGMHASVHCWWKCIFNTVDCVDKQCFVSQNLLYQVLLLCFFLKKKKEANFKQFKDVICLLEALSCSRVNTGANCKLKLNLYN